MSLSIKVSEVMRRNQALFVEDRVLRVPQAYREEVGIQLGEFLKVKTRAGKKLLLQVAKAYNEDIIRDEHTAYVSAATYEILDNSSSIEHVPEITLGCDPEFFLVDRDDGRVVHAGTYFRKWDSMGHDGMLAELRPMPHTKAEVVTENIKALLSRGSERLRGTKRNLRMTAHSAYRSLTAGFHVHLGLHPKLLGSSTEVYRVSSQIVRLLDYYVGVPCVIQEGLADAGRRCTALLPYGKAGDFRLDYRTLEYRVPGGALLKHPVLARGLLSLAGLIAEDVSEHIQDVTNNFSNMNEVYRENSLARFYPNVPGMMNLYGLICVPNIDGALAHLDIILDDIRHMKGYSRRANEIEQFFEYLPIQFDNDLEKNWGILKKGIVFN